MRIKKVDLTLEEGLASQFVNIQGPLSPSRKKKLLSQKHTKCRNLSTYKKIN